jgi:hypothetical protein
MGSISFFNDFVEPFGRPRFLFIGTSEVSLSVGIISVSFTGTGE